MVWFTVCILFLMILGVLSVLYESDFIQAEDAIRDYFRSLIFKILEV